MLKRYYKKETFIYDNKQECDLKALEYGDEFEVTKLVLIGCKEENEDDEYLVEVSYSYGDDEEDGDS